MGRLDHDVMVVAIPAGERRSFGFSTSHLVLQAVTDNTGATVATDLDCTLGQEQVARLRVGQLIRTDRLVPVHGLSIANPSAADVIVTFGWGLGDFEDFTTIIRDPVAVGPATGVAGLLLNAADLRGGQGAPLVLAGGPGLVGTIVGAYGEIVEARIYVPAGAAGLTTWHLTDANGTPFYHGGDPAGGGSIFHNDQRFVLPPGAITLVSSGVNAAAVVCDGLVLVTP